MQDVKTVTQTITTTVGKAYLFSFKAACRENNVVGLTVWADNTQAPDLTIADGGLSATSFQTYSFVFMGNGVQTLQFVNSGTADFTADVTDVSVTELDISSSVVNGDFSSNAALFTEGNSYFAAQSTGNPESAPGWTGGSGIGGTLGSAPDYFGPVNGAIPSYLFMQGAKTVTQTILTTVGTTYLLSFKAACRQGNVVGLTVWADNTQAPNLTIPVGGLSGTSFQTYSIMFTGSGVQTLQFVNSGTGDFTANVTDVAVTEEFGSPEAPVFTQTPQSQTVTNADSVTFTAQATGYPTPIIVWHFVDTNAVDHLLSTVGNTLTFTAKSADAGHYYAAASNSQGTTNSPSALLTVIPGQVSETDLSLSGGSFAPLAGNNLILGNAGSSALSITGDGDGTGSASLLTDGDLGAPQTGGPLGIAGGSITYNLGSGANGMGYDITGIRSLSAWADGGRFKPKYAVSYSVDGLNFIPLWTVDYSTATGNGADVSLAITGLIKVTAIKFDFSGGQQNGWVSYRELAVFGRSTFPSGTVLMLY